jgi:hypothetical protein
LIVGVFALKIQPTFPSFLYFIGAGILSFGHGVDNLSWWLISLVIILDYWK